MLAITPYLALAPGEIEEQFTRSPGPGGQNVNKVATAVILRFDVARSASLPEPVRTRLLQLARGRISRDGFLIIHAHAYRTREQNRRDARERLVHWVRRALHAPVPRIATRPPPAARRQRLQDKRSRATVKLRRGPVRADD